jgi:glycolate oxidase FAD binding subunit
VTTLRPGSTAELVDAVRSHPRVVAHGALTKAPLVASYGGAVRLDLTRLSGVTEYEPQEYTFTAGAGTPLREVEALLAEHGQRLPFDPPFGEEGATLGGTVAAGMNGPGRLRYGGIRDFIIGVRYVDGTGTLVRGGGKVVKNAAGFDLPKLLVGSMGRLGVIAEVTFKVFPAPQAWRTLRVTCTGLADAVACVTALGLRPLELEALEITPPDTLMIRVSGDAAAVDAHARRVAEATGRPHEQLGVEEDAAYWQAERAFAWVEEGRRLVKVPVTPRAVLELDATAERAGIGRRFGVACNVAWLTPPAELPLDRIELGGRTGLLVRGPLAAGESPWIGPMPGRAGAFARALKFALDPGQRLPALA